MRQSDIQKRSEIFSKFVAGQLMFVSGRLGRQSTRTEFQVLDVTRFDFPQNGPGFRLTLLSLDGHQIHQMRARELLDIEDITLKHIADVTSPPTPTLTGPISPGSSFLLTPVSSSPQFPFQVPFNGPQVLPCRS